VHLDQEVAKLQPEMEKEVAESNQVQFLMGTALIYAGSPAIVTILISSSLVEALEAQLLELKEVAQLRLMEDHLLQGAKALALQLEAQLLLVLVDLLLQAQDLTEAAHLLLV